MKTSSAVSEKMSVVSILNREKVARVISHLWFRKTGIQSTLPVELLSLVSDFYGKLNMWNSEDKDSCIHVSNEGRTVTHDHDPGVNHLIRAIYPYKNGIHKWKMKIDTFNCAGRGGNWGGIATLESPRVCNWNLEGKQVPGFYGVDLFSFEDLDGVCKLGKHHVLGDNQSETWLINEGDEVDFELDFDEMKLFVSFNDKRILYMDGFPKGVPLYPALFLGALEPNQYTTSFDLS